MGVGSGFGSVLGGHSIADCGSQRHNHGGTRGKAQGKPSAVLLMGRGSGADRSVRATQSPLLFQRRLVALVDFFPVDYAPPCLQIFGRRLLYLR